MGNHADNDFAPIAGDVAKALLGDANRSLSSKTELRFGKNGSLSVDLAKGTIFDHEGGQGGGVLWLIERETGKKGRDAVEWLRDHDFHIEDRRGDEPAAGSNRNHGPRDGAKWSITGTWDYVDEAGKLLFQVIRQENGERKEDGKPKKKYLQRRPDGNGGWLWKTEGMRLVPYRLPEVIEAVAKSQVIFVCEGEKAADKLIELGIPATTNARGAKKWTDELNEYFHGARVVILPDNDDTGREHADMVGRALTGIAKDIRLLDLPNLPPKGDAADWVAAGGQTDDLYQMAFDAQPFEASPFRSRFNAVTWANLDAPGPEHEWAVKGLLTRGEIGMVAGPSKSGKTFFALALSMAIARGTDFFGRRTLKGGVVYQAGEGARGIKKRLRAYRQFHELGLTNPMPFVLLPSRIDLYNSSDCTEEFIEEVRHWSSTFPVPLELIVIDTWATATAGANENDGKDVSVILERCAYISRQTGAAVLLVHHMNADGAKVRGHTSILANLENVLIVRQVEGLHDDNGRQIREAVVDKNKDGESGQKLRFVLKSEKVGQDEDGDPVTSCVVCNVEGNGSDEPVPERPGVTDTESLIVRAIERAQRYSNHPRPNGGTIPENVTLVLWKDVLTEWDKMQFDHVPEDETAEDRIKRLDARRKMMRRYGESLLRKNVVGREEPFIWLTGRRIKGYRPESRQTEQNQSSAPAAGYQPDAFEDSIFGDE